MENEPYKLKYLDIRIKNTLKKALRLQNIFRELLLSVLMTSNWEEGIKHPNLTLSLIF